MVNKKRIIDLFTELVEVGSESGSEGKFRDLLVAKFEKRGLKAVEDDAATITKGDSGNLLVRVPGTIEADPILFSGHMDTVRPGVGIEVIIEDGIIKSKGETILGSDDKAAIAAIIEAYDVLIENNIDYPPLEFLFTVCEEKGLKGVKAFDFTSLKSTIGYVLDAGGDPGNIVIKSPAQNRIEYKVWGQAAHAGINPEDGVNAIKLAGLALSKMPSGRIDEETTCNLGIISGGKARNVVADYCAIKGEARSLSRNKLDNLTEKLAHTFKTTVEENGGRAEVQVTFLYPEISLNPDDAVVKSAVKAMKSIDLKPILASTGGGSDASIINGKGISCANLGIGMQKVHTNEEFIKVNDLVSNAKIVLAIIEQFTAQN
ncbi:MAG TPA: M20/M25/M40 family metallo-hydrolase [Syntrophomonadaceae bacterium]|nr:M20/M25/M40 family metallo-hydrolase [Syntrophomonadaceae bacterium]